MHAIKHTLTKRDRGFTLIELLVVIAIIAVLAALILAALSSAQKGARDSKRRSDLNQYKTALSQFASDNNGSYGTAQATAASITGTGTLPCSNTGWSNYMTSGGNCLTGTTANPYYYVTNAGSSDFGVCVQLERDSTKQYAVGPTFSGDSTGTASACTVKG